MPLLRVAGRATDKDFANFVTMAVGSSNEAEHHLGRALDGGVLTEARAPLLDR